MAFPVFPFLANTAANLLNRGRQFGVESFDRVTIIDSPGTLTDVSTILSARGAFYRVELSARSGPAMYAIDELTRDSTAPDAVFPVAQNLALDALTPADQNFYEELARRSTDSESTAVADRAFTLAPVLITGIQLAQSDIVGAISGLDNFKVFYTFGQSFGQVAITGEVLLGTHGDFEVRGLERVLNFFATHRVSVSHRPVKLSICSKVYLIYLTGLQLGRIDPQFHILPFTLTGTLLDPSNDEPGHLNVGTEVVNDRSRPSLFSALALTQSDRVLVGNNAKEDAAKTGNNNDNSTAPSVDFLSPNTLEGIVSGEATADGNTIANAVANNNNKQVDRKEDLLRQLAEAQARTPELTAAATDSVGTKILKWDREISDKGNKAAGEAWDASLEWMRTEPAAAIEVLASPVRAYLTEAGDMTSRSISHGVEAVGDYFSGRATIPSPEWNGPVL